MYMCACMYSITCFEWSPSVYGHFSLSDQYFMLISMVNLSIAVHVHFSGLFSSQKQKLFSGHGGMMTVSLCNGPQVG